MVGNLGVSGRTMPYLNLKGNTHDIFPIWEYALMLMYISQYSNEEEDQRNYVLPIQSREHETKAMDQGVGEVTGEAAV